MDSQYIINMKFRTEGNRNHTISLSEAKLDADDGAGLVMDKIIDDNIFTTTSGDLVEKVSVTMVIRDYDEIIIPA